MASNEKKQTMREEFFKESFDLAQKQRLGMFSLPVSIAVGDDKYFIPVPSRKNAEGQVVTGPRNFTTKNVKKGTGDGVLFSKPSYISSGDPFQDVAKMTLRSYKKDAYKEIGHNFNFKPAKAISPKIGGDFEHMQDYENVKKNFKSPEGGVIVGPKNFVTSPPKIGQIGKGIYFGDKFEHMQDPFDAQKQLALKELEEHHQKIQDKPFSNKVKHTDTFASPLQTFGEDKEIPPKKIPSPRSPLITHDRAFRPSNPAKRGFNKTLGKIPEYIEDPLKFATRKKSPDGSNEKSWKPTHNSKTIPIPSVLTMSKNLKTEFPSYFRRSM